jgi:hypothetical protein
MADRLGQIRQSRFVGRLSELGFFQSLLLAPEPAILLLSLAGPGGIGKTSLLQAWMQQAARVGRPLVLIDGRQIAPHPPAFVQAIGQQLGLAEPTSEQIWDRWPQRSILLIDTYEQLRPLDDWLRDSFLPQLPSDSLVVIAGRDGLGAAWQSDAAWSQLTHQIVLEPLQPEESAHYLQLHQIPAELQAELLRFCHGHPLALALSVDLLHQQGQLEHFRPHEEPDLLGSLLGRFLAELPSPQQREALETLALTWAANEALLAELYGPEAAHELFEWLRQLSSVQQTPAGLVLHDSLREVLLNDLRWRNPQRYQSLAERILLVLLKRLRQTKQSDQLRLWLDFFSLTRQHPFFQSYFDWDSLGSYYADSVRNEEFAQLEAQIAAFEGQQAAELLRYWRERQPEALIVFRSVHGQIVGWMCQLALRIADLEQEERDPALLAARAWLASLGQFEPHEQIAYTRFWLDKTHYQVASPSLNLAAIYASMAWTSLPKLGYSFVAVADPGYHAEHFASIHFSLLPEAAFEQDGRLFEVFGHNWRAQPFEAWLMSKQQLIGAISQTEAEPTPSEWGRLSDKDFAKALRQALRDFHSQPQLAENPLLQTALVRSHADGRSGPEVLQGLLEQAATSLESSPRNQKLYRALWQTYFEASRTQEQVAELLDLPFNTYRYQLQQAIERVTHYLLRLEEQARSLS